jgi:hypothetical protein
MPATPSPTPHGPTNGSSVGDVVAASGDGLGEAKDAVGAPITVGEAELEAGSVVAARIFRAAGRSRFLSSGKSASPGQLVNDISRCPAIGQVVTEEPFGHRFEPREVKRIVRPADRSIPSRTASQASSAAAASSARPAGGSQVKLPMKQTSSAWPWLPPVASPRTGPARLPVRPSHSPPNGSTKKL